MDGFEDIIKEFLVESYENLDKLDDDLLALEDTPDDQQRLASIFRTVHTIKGTCGFLALPKLERITHVGENLLVPLRDGELTLTRPIADTLLEMVDAIRAMLRQVESGQGEGDDDYETLVARLEAARTQPTATQVDPSAAPMVSEPSVSIADQPQSENTATTSEASGQVGADGASGMDRDNAAESPLHQQAAPEPAAPEQATPRDAASEQATSERARCDWKEAPGLTKNEASLVDASVRLDVELLDKLVNLVGELVLARNQIVQFSRSNDDAPLHAAAQRLNQITSELQEGVLKTRMQPIRNAWGKLPRLVRDLAASHGKQVDIRMEGEETEVDKTVLEAIKDPLTHIVRNVVDHGIELPERRIACGKPPRGVLHLNAFHEGGQMIIEISDDGGGIDTNLVRAKAIERGIISNQRASTLSESDITPLILLPGFSTAASVTNVSGRGVGMDVVKTNIECIGGSLEIQSTLGLGTTLRIKIPLTLAIMPVLLVATEGDRYAIPQASLLELVHIDSLRARQEIEFIHDAPLFRLREQLLPLIYLDEQLGLHPPRRRGDPTSDLNIVVLDADGHQFGLVVDEIIDTQEIVIKPLGSHFREIPVYAGATIMGDGTICLILDLIGLAQSGGITGGQAERKVPITQPPWHSNESPSESLLIVDLGDESRVAIPLSSVARLEKFESSDIERLGDFHVVQYRGQTIPLFSIDGSLECQLVDVSSRQLASESPLHTVVFHDGDRVAGVVVTKILDILHNQPVHADPEGGQAGAARHLVIQQRVTRIIDLNTFLRSALRHWADAWFAA
ncbi:chemotaxis protein CheA [Stieleria sp. ICT_E10.1]|uniref:chemotaxis protein CheA n=1 Tax=Stieleria sedimenti TaxID=2976331 RepID=UPI0021804969|nr:chemotaxis protein CheA [Stieleria sedimenti]MCS7466024.1 chemotaxis protein CheA [Stieleria sedimenti]